MPCPYLPGRLEQQLFTELSGPWTQDDFERLSQGGFRRSHHIVYRPACRGCNACIPVRVVATEFETTRSWRRVLRANADLTAQDIGKRVTEEQYLLFRKYVTSRHGEGDMARMNRRDYAAMVVSSPVATGMIEFREPMGRLVAACLIDRMSDGLSAVYSFYDVAAGRRSLGSYVVLQLIEHAREVGLGYVYLGFWVEGSPKMAYKSRFRPVEGFGPGGWHPLGQLGDAKPASATSESRSIPGPLP